MLGFAVVCLVAGAAFAKGPVGPEVLSFEYANGQRYIDCVGEVVASYLVRKTRYHEFETPSRVVHIIDQWKFKLFDTGLTGGRTWVAEAVPTLQLNTKVETGQVQQRVTNMMPGSEQMEPE